MSLNSTLGDDIYNPVITEKILDTDILLTISSNLNNIEIIKDELRNLLTNQDNVIYDKNNHELQMLSISKTNLSIYQNEQEGFIDYEKEILLVDIKKLVKKYNEYLHEIISLLGSGIQGLEYKTLDDYNYIFKLKIDKILENNTSIYVLVGLSDDEIKVNPYKLINKLYKKKYDQYINLYNEVFYDEDDIMEQAKIIEKQSIPNDNTLEYLYNWEEYIEKRQTLDLKDFKKQSQIFLKEITSINDVELQNNKREEILQFINYNLDFHITKIVYELGLEKFITIDFNPIKKYTKLYHQIYKILMKNNYKNTNYSILLNLLNEYTNITEGLILTEDIRTEKRKLLRLHDNGGYQGILYLPTFNQLDNLLKK